jgi:hypothetical protein
MRSNNIFTSLSFYKILVCLIGLLIFTNSSYGQADRSLFFLPILPNARTANPAIFPQYNLYVGIPFVSSVKTGFENTFTYDDIFRQEGDSLYLDREYLLDNLDNKNVGNINLMEEWLTFGMKVKNNYLHFRVADIANVNASVGWQFLSFMLYGNGSEQYLGKTATFDKNSLNLTYYREYSFGYTRQLTDKLNLGANLKYLDGIANIYTDNLNVQLTTDSVDFTLTAQTDIRINTSIPWTEGSGFQPAELFKSYGNPGFAIDLGGFYTLDDKWSFSASLLNLGKINWKSNLKNYVTQNPDASVEFSGFELGDFIENGGLNQDNINNVLDSIADELGIVEVKEAYKAPVPTTMMLNANYNLGEKNRFSGLISTQFLEDRTWPSLSLAYTRKFSDNINLMFSYTAFPQSYLNLGAGFAVNMGPLQFYLVSENLIAPILLSKSSFFQVRFGFNLVFDAKGKKKANEQEIMEQ